MWQSLVVAYHFIETASDSKETDMNSTTAKPHEGVVKAVAGDKITTTCSKGNDHVHTVAKDAKVSCDGQTCKTSDLKVGSTVHVTTHKDDKKIATAIDCGKHIPAMAKKS